jgi:hypothetical protein
MIRCLLTDASLSFGIWANLVPRSKLGYFLGYPRNTIGYRILLDSGKVVETSDVLFFDSTVLDQDSNFFSDSSTVKKKGFPVLLLETEEGREKIADEIARQNLPIKNTAPNIPIPLKAAASHEEEIVGRIEEEEEDEQEELHEIGEEEGGQQDLHEIVHTSNNTETEKYRPAIANEHGGEHTEYLENLESIPQEDPQADSQPSTPQEDTQAEDTPLEDPQAEHQISEIILKNQEKSIDRPNYQVDSIVAELGRIEAKAEEDRLAKDKMVEIENLNNPRYNLRSLRNSLVVNPSIPTRTGPPGRVAKGIKETC